MLSEFDIPNMLSEFGDTVSDVATELILDVTNALSIIKLCISALYGEIIALLT